MEKDFTVSPALENKDAADWYEMTEEVFGKFFSESPLQRPGLEMIKRNVRFISPPGETQQE
jgi:epoxyqueuosine reductase QueG